MVNAKQMIALTTGTTVTMTPVGWLQFAAALVV